MMSARPASGTDGAERISAELSAVSIPRKEYILAKKKSNTSQSSPWNFHKKAIGGHYIGNQWRVQLNRRILLTVLMRLHDNFASIPHGWNHQLNGIIKESTIELNN
jgi:hypothetical protein